MRPYNREVFAELERLAEEVQGLSGEARRKKCIEAIERLWKLRNDFDESIRSRVFQAFIDSLR